MIEHLMPPRSHIGLACIWFLQSALDVLYNHHVTNIRSDLPLRSEINHIQYNTKTIHSENFIRLLEILIIDKVKILRMENGLENRVPQQPNLSNRNYSSKVGVTTIKTHPLRKRKEQKMSLLKTMLKSRSSVKKFLWGRLGRRYLALSNFNLTTESFS